MLPCCCTEYSACHRCRRNTAAVAVVFRLTRRTERSAGDAGNPVSRGICWLGHVPSFLEQVTLLACADCLPCSATSLPYSALCAESQTASCCGDFVWSPQCRDLVAAGTRARHGTCVLPTGLFPRGAPRAGGAGSPSFHFRDGPSISVRFSAAVSSFLRCCCAADRGEILAASADSG